MNTEETHTQQLKAINEGLDVVIPFGLEAEVIYEALKYMKQNPTVTPAEAFFMGVTEWVK